jgi:hypothetical protein
MPDETLVVKKVVIGGREFPIVEGSTTNEDAVSEIFSLIEAVDEAESPDFILSTSTAAYR